VFPRVLQLQRTVYDNANQPAPIKPLMAIELLPRVRPRLIKYLSTTIDVWPEQVCGIVKRHSWADSWRRDEDVWFGPFFFAGEDLETSPMRRALDGAWTHFVLQRTGCQVYTLLNDISRMMPAFYRTDCCSYIALWSEG
jgi:hypothetical protein